MTAKFADGHGSVDVTLARPLPPDVVSQKIGALAGVSSVTPLDPKRVRLKFSGGITAQEQLVEALIGLHLGVISVAESESALEEVYLSQIARGD